jgi:hypothetical protein
MNPHTAYHSAHGCNALAHGYWRGYWRRAA